MNVPEPDPLPVIPEDVRHEIDRKLLEGLTSGEPIEVNESFWADRRRVLAERLNQQAKESA